MVEVPKLKKSPHFRGASKIFFVRVSLLLVFQDWIGVFRIWILFEFFVDRRFFRGIWMFGLVFKGQWISFVADVKVQKRMAEGKLIRPAFGFARRTKDLPDERKNHVFYRCKIRA